MLKQKQMLRFAQHDMGPGLLCHQSLLHDTRYTAEEATKEALRCVRCDLWSVKGVPEVWWQRRGLRPYWLGGQDRFGRERDAGKVQAFAIEADKAIASLP